MELKPLFLLLTTILVFSLASIAISATDLSTPKKAVLVSIDGFLSEIDVPTKEYVIDEGLALARERGVPLIVVVNTYGGYLDPAIEIANSILESDVPVIGFIKDKALSAGSIIVLPMHIVGISPHGVVGAAQPIMINPVTGEVTFVNQSKIVNPIIAMAKRYAEARGRNTTAVEMFIKQNLVLTGKEAVEEGIADVVASSVDDLIQRIRGWKINISGREVAIDIAGYEELKPSIRTLAYAILRDRLINSILWFIGFFGTFAALLSGRIDILPFTIVMLLLGLIGSGMNINVVALVLLALGSAMLVVELFLTPGFGILGVSGIIALVFGLLLMPFIPGKPVYATNIEGIRNTMLIIGGGLGGFLGFVLFKAIESRRKRRIIGFTPEKVVGVGRALDRIEPGKRGYVQVEGELWEAESDEVIEPGEEVEVIERRGFVLKVKKRRS